ncbi:MAG: SDR family oxidoreductase [Planctomycetes bacterium]|nr:SDR family oxidoreductase [Planctomycetota bacterium]
MANCLVTGGAGFIGSHLVEGLLEQDHSVRVLDDFSTGKRDNLAAVARRIEVIDGDISDPDVCLKACADIDWVFHQAAVPSVPQSVDNPEASHNANVNGTFNILMAARARKCRRVIYAASSSAYGDSDVSPKHEGLMPQPVSPYAVQKLTGEYYARAFFECFGLETLSIRYFNVFGPRQDPESQYAAAVPAFVTAVLADRPPTVYGDGEQTRDFSYIDNVVYGNLLAAKAEKTHGEVINVACGYQVTINQIIRRVNELLGRDVKPLYAAPRPGDVRHSLADIRLAKQLIGYEPIVNFEEGLAKAIDYYASLSG